MSQIIFEHSIDHASYLISGYLLSNMKHYFWTTLRCTLSKLLWRLHPIVRSFRSDSTKESFIWLYSEAAIRRCDASRDQSRSTSKRTHNFLHRDSNCVSSIAYTKSLLKGSSPTVCLRSITLRMRLPTGTFFWRFLMSTQLRWLAKRLKTFVALKWFLTSVRANVIV